MIIFIVPLIIFYNSDVVLYIITFMDYKETTQNKGYLKHPIAGYS